MPINFPAIVLSRAGTGLATIRCLSAGGVDIHAAIFSRREAVNYTRLATKHLLTGQSDEHVIGWLKTHARDFGDRPMLFATGDADALLLAEHRDELKPHYRLWNNDRENLLNIISKERLYRLTATANIPVVPSIYQPSATELDAWTSVHPGPYLIKPSYEGSPNNTLHKKNIGFDSRSTLMVWAAQNDLSGLIIQRRLHGGDGNIFDCYGYCDSAGRIVTIATHRRWRQHLPDIGATSFGEIPAREPHIESKIIEQTRELLRVIRYHGIFGIEWLHDTNDGALYLIDFNARPFSTISHLADCGLNLPYLAMMETAGDDISKTPAQPELQHKFWIDFLRDFETYTLKRANGDIGFVSWIKSLLRCRSFAYWSWRDPGPGLYQLFQMLKRMSRKGLRAVIAFTQLIPFDF